MSFGSLKTLKLERVIGDATLSITTHVPIDADNIEEFDKLDESIVGASTHLREVSPEGSKAESKPSSYPTIGKAEKPKPEVVKEEVEEKPKQVRKKGAGRPKGSTKAKTKPELVPVKEEVAKTTPAPLATQDEKTALVKNFQSTFENEIGFASEDTYMDEFNEFMNSLISMTYEAFLEAEITTAQLNTFKDLV